MTKPKGLSIVLEFGRWYTGWDFEKDHSYISLGWVSFHVYTFAYLEHIESAFSRIASLVALTKMVSEMAIANEDKIV